MKTDVWVCNERNGGWWADPSIYIQIGPKKDSVSFFWGITSWRRLKDWTFVAHLIISSMPPDSISEMFIHCEPPHDFHLIYNNEDYKEPIRIFRDNYCPLTNSQKDWLFRALTQEADRIRREKKEDKKHPAT